MLKLIARKIAALIILLPLLNAVGFFYATIHPRLFTPAFGNVSVPDHPDYLTYIRGLFRGDLGIIARQVTVAEVIIEPLKNSLILVSVSLVVAVVLGVVLGLSAVSRKTRRMRPSALVFFSAGSSMPGFILGGMLLSAMVYQTLYAGARQTLLPISGFGLDEHLILPVLVLSLHPMLNIAKVTSSLLEHELQQDYIRVARGKGLGWWMLLWRHAVPNMIAPVLVTIGEAMRLIVGALVIVEPIFIWPGIGRIFLFTIGLRLDARPPGIYFGSPPLLAAIVVILGFFLLFADLLTSVLIYWADPRMSKMGEDGVR
ncbi:MAG: ABC transporter permease [Chloroflexi bacterium]|nr:MAG: ABC transporter permease [Chloroflexota bacterium]